MTARILGTVNSCIGCPHRQYYSAGIYECSKVDRALIPSEVMPSWCPLPTYPAVDVAAIIAQARAELVAEMKAAPAGYLIDWPDEPDLGHYYAEDSTNTGRCQPLAVIPKA